MAELELVPQPEDEEPVTTAGLRAQLQRIEDERLAEEARDPDPEPAPEPQPQPRVEMKVTQAPGPNLRPAKRVIRDAQGRIEYIIDVLIDQTEV